MDVSTVTNQEAKFFITHFLKDRAINKKFYELIPEDKYNFRMVNTAEKKSDCPRESIIHQITAQRCYIEGIKTGVLQFGLKYEDLQNASQFSKEELLTLLEKTDKELIELLSDEHNLHKKVKVPWSPEPIPAVASLWALDSHEIFHQGWNLAIMDHLNIERFPEFKAVWG